MVKTGPESMSEKTMLHKSETAIDFPDPVADKWLSHKITSVMSELYRIKVCCANESFFARYSILLLF